MEHIGGLEKIMEIMELIKIDSFHFFALKLKNFNSFFDYPLILFPLPLIYHPNPAYLHMTEKIGTIN